MHQRGFGKVIGLIFDPNRNSTLWFVRYATFIVRVGGKPWSRKGITHLHSQLGLPDTCRAIKELIIYNSVNVSVFDLLNDLVLCCYQLPHRYESYIKNIFDKNLYIIILCSISYQIVVTKGRKRFFFSENFKNKDNGVHK